MELSIWQEYKDQDFILLGISSNSTSELLSFIEDQGITYPILHDDSGVYSDYNLLGGPSPYPRDFIVDQEGIIRYANAEYDPGTMIIITESLLGVGNVKKFIRADANADSTINMSDVTHTLRHLYVPGSLPPPCMKGADTNDSGFITMSDVIYTLRYLYIPGGPEPPFPFPNCGSDPTPDQLDCDDHLCNGTVYLHGGSLHE